MAERGQGEQLKVSGRKQLQLLYVPSFLCPLSPDMLKCKCDWTIPVRRWVISRGLLVHSVACKTMCNQAKNQITSHHVVQKGEILLSYCVCHIVYDRRQRLKATCVVWKYQCRVFYVLVFRCVCVGVCKNSSRVCVYVCTEECVHAELFVAGLAPWEPILHLSIPHSRALILPKIHQRMTLFLSGIVDPIILRHCALLSLCSLTPTVCLTLSLFLFLTDIYTHKDLSFTPRMLFFTLRQSHCHAYTHLSVMSLE